MQAPHGVMQTPRGVMQTPRHFTLFKAPFAYVHEIVYLCTAKWQLDAKSPGRSIADPVGALVPGLVDIVSPNWYHHLDLPLPAACPFPADDIIQPANDKSVIFKSIQRRPDDR